jgi:membrane-associated phospholipid phosphatase
VSTLVSISEESKADQIAQGTAGSARNLGIVFSGIYLAALGAFCVRFSVIPGPEFLVVCFLVYAAYAKWTRRFLKDWAPFIALFLAFEAMRGISYNMLGTVHVSELASAESQIFGAIPTLVLQQFYRSAVLDSLGAFFYSLHFIIPTVFGFILWRYSPKNYWKYICAFLVCSYAALITALLYPSAPPWFGVNATRILYQVDNEIGAPVYHLIFDYIQSNPFAAFPSLHAAYPWLISLTAIKIKRIRALPIIALPIGVWFSAVYLGEHYVIDIIGGVAYSTCAFLLSEKLISRFSLNKAGNWLKNHFQF